jgi:cysteine desulfurase
VGVLWVRRGIPLLSQITGGGQERGRRAGTEHLAGIVGMAAALRLAEERRTGYVAHCTALRDQLIAGVLSTIPAAHLNGDATHRLPNNANLRFVGVESESLLILLDQQGICASSGSACTSGALDPSHVLLALGHSHEQANSAIRLTVGKDVSSAEIAQAVAALQGAVGRLRGE